MLDWFCRHKWTKVCNLISDTLEERMQCVPNKERAKVGELFRCENCLRTKNVLYR